MSISHIILSGRSGRMGREIDTLLTDAGIEVFGIDSVGPSADVLIDFSVPAALDKVLGKAKAMAVPMVIGTTGYTDNQQGAIADAARDIPIVQAGNMSLGITLLQALVAQAAAALGPDFDIDIHDVHHRAKRDAPSGTALMLGAAVETARADLKSRDPGAHVGPRPDGLIDYAVARTGGVIGDHAVVFTSGEEQITLSHRALNRAVFARGALAAARWVVDKPAGHYDMAQVLGLRPL